MQRQTDVVPNVREGLPRQAQQDQLRQVCLAFGPVGHELRVPFQRGMPGYFRNSQRGNSQGKEYTMKGWEKITSMVGDQTDRLQLHVIDNLHTVGCTFSETIVE